MTGRFNDINLEWKEKKYTIPRRKVMEAIARIEEHITLSELLGTVATRQTIKMVKIARAYASVLQIAGVSDITDEEVYFDMFSTGGGIGTTHIADSVQALLMMMIPPDRLKEWEKVEVPTSGEEDGPLGNPNGQARSAAPSLSKKLTKRQERGDSPETNSGQ